MDIEQFTEFKTGKLVSINDRPRGRWAFVPDPLPPKFHMTDRLWALLNEASRKIEKLNGLGSALPSPSLLLRPLQRREALTSNSLEGTYVTPKELLLFETEKAEALDLTTPNPKLADWLEVTKYDAALQLGSKRMRENHPLNRELLCELHTILLDGVRGRDKSPGVVRKSQVHVGVEARYVPPPPEEVDAALDNWETYLASDDGVDPVIRACIAHYQFEAIHPFMDGNGRLGRLWLSLTLQRWLSHSHAWLYMSEFFEKHRRDYIDRLFRVSTHGEWSEWIEFCLLGTRAQAEASILRCEALKDLKIRCMRSVQGPRSPQIIDQLFENPFVDVPRLMKSLGVSHPTARKDVEEFERAGILARVEGHERPKVYVALEVFNTTYRD